MKYILTTREVKRLLLGKRITFGKDALYLSPDDISTRKTLEDYTKTRPMRMLYCIEYDSEKMSISVLKRERKPKR